MRVAACEAFVPLLSACERRVWQGSLLDYSLDALLVHLDDPDAVIQDAVQRVVAAAIAIDAERVARRCAQARQQHRSPVRCDDLVRQAQAAMAAAAR